MAIASPGARLAGRLVTRWRSPPVEKGDSDRVDRAQVDSVAGRDVTSRARLALRTREVVRPP